MGLVPVYSVQHSPNSPLYPCFMGQNPTFSPIICLLSSHTDLFVQVLSISSLDTLFMIMTRYNFVCFGIFCDHWRTACRTALYKSHVFKASLACFAVPSMTVIHSANYRFIYKFWPRISSTSGVCTCRCESIPFLTKYLRVVTVVFGQRGRFCRNLRSSHTYFSALHIFGHLFRPYA